MMIYRLAIASLCAIVGGGYFADAQTPATCVDPELASAATQQCNAQFETTECGGRNDSRGNCDDAIDRCYDVCSGDCGCTKSRTGCSSSISVSNCLLSTTYDIDCKSTLDLLPDCVEGYTVYDTGGCRARNELGSFRNIASAALCAEKCDADDTCVSFEYNPVNSRYSCQLSTSCDQFSLTVNSKGSEYLWYARDSKFKTEAPTPAPTNFPTSPPVPELWCEVCASGVTEPDAVLSPDPDDPVDWCGELQSLLDVADNVFFAGDGIFLPCSMAPIVVEVCCPSTGIVVVGTLPPMMPISDTTTPTGSPTGKPVTGSPTGSPVGTPPMMPISDTTTPTGSPTGKPVTGSATTAVTGQLVRGSPTSAGGERSLAVGVIILALFGTVVAFL